MFVHTKPLSKRPNVCTLSVTKKCEVFANYPAMKTQRVCTPSTNKNQKSMHNIRQ